MRDKALYVLRSALPVVGQQINENLNEGVTGGELAFATTMNLLGKTVRPYTGRDTVDTDVQYEYANALTTIAEHLAQDKDPVTQAAIRRFAELEGKRWDQLTTRETLVMEALMV